MALENLIKKLFDVYVSRSESDAYSASDYSERALANGAAEILGLYWNTKSY